jgi:hypothetical protein
MKTGEELRKDERQLFEEKKGRTVESRSKIVKYYHHIV